MVPCTRYIVLIYSRCALCMHAPPCRYAYILTIVGYSKVVWKWYSHRRSFIVMTLPSALWHWLMSAHINVTKNLSGRELLLDMPNHHISGFCLKFLISFGSRKSRRATANEWLLVNQRVSGAVGDYVEGPTKRRRWQRLHGNIDSTVGELRCLVKFDNGLEKECALAVLRVERTHSSLPPDLPLPTAWIEHQADEGDVQEALIDQDEEEPLAAESPDDDDDDESCESNGGVRKPEPLGKLYKSYY